jgi:hypothetical protein
MEHARKFRPVCLSALLLVIGALALAVHFEIYHQTSASAFVNQPVFYYNRFYIRNSDGHATEVSLRAGFWSYITAAFSVASLSWGVTRLVVAKKRRRAASPER